MSHHLASLVTSSVVGTSLSLAAMSSWADVGLAVLSFLVAGVLAIGGTVLLLRPRRSRRVTSDGKSPHPDYASDGARAPQPIDPSTGQHRAHWVLPAEERAKGFVRPVRLSYRHKTCGAWTTMGLAIAETCARDPKFYRRTFCIECERYLPSAQFEWEDGSQVGS